MVFDNGTITADNSTSYTSIYDGTTNTYAAQNRYVFVTIAAGGNLTRYLYFKNEADGNIYLNGTGDTLANFASEDSTSYGGTYLENRGTIELNGIKSELLGKIRLGFFAGGVSDGKTSIYNHIVVCDGGS